MLIVHAIPVEYNLIGSGSTIDLYMSFNAERGNMPYILFTISVDGNNNTQKIAGFSYDKAVNIIDGMLHGWRYDDLFSHDDIVAVSRIMKEMYN